MKNTKGFGVVEVIIVLVMLGLVGVGGWYVWEANRRPGDSPQASTITTPTKATDPYENWKTYCDNTNKACFKYPPSWQVTANNSPNQVYAKITDPSGSIIVTYANPDTRDGTTMAFYTADLENLSNADLRFKVVGGYSILSNLAPGYWLTSGIFISDALKEGQQSEYANSPRFVNNSNIYATFSAEPAKALSTESESKAWFSSDAGKTSALVIKSFYLQ